MTTAPITPKELSAVQVAPRRMPLPYGLTWPDMSALLPHFGSHGTAWLTHQKNGVHQGGLTSVIMTVRYAGSDQRLRRVPVFVKRNGNTGRREASRYRFLSGRGIAVCRLLGAVERDGAEVMVLEFLPEIGVRPEDADEMVGLIASVNALSEVPESLSVPPTGMEQAAFEVLLEDALVRLAAGHPAVRPDAWLAAYRRASAAYRELPQALTHGELAPQQVGRDAEGTLVLFDLETMGLRPRFVDVASVLRSLAGHTGRTEGDVFSRYLRNLSASGGDSLELGQVWDELLLSRVVGKLETLPWLVPTTQPAAEEWVGLIADDLCDLALV